MFRFRKYIVLLIALLTVQNSYSYCIDPSRPVFDPGPIPVYISNNLSTSVRNIGIQYDLDASVDNDDSNNYEIEQRWVQAAIEIINSSSSGAPPLYYAGLTYTPGANFNFNDLLPGITIASWTCNRQPSDSIAGQSASLNSSLIRFNRGGSQSCPTQCNPQENPNCIVCDWDSDPSTCPTWYVDPDQKTTLGANWDFLGVLVHELGHSLGLGHSNHPESTWNTNCENDFQGDIGASVMNTSYQQDWRHTLRRDDIEGLRSLYGKPQRAIHTSNLDTKFSYLAPQKEAWTRPRPLGQRMITNTPVALSSTADNSTPSLLAGYTRGSSDRFRFFNGFWYGWDIGPTGNGYKVPSDIGDKIKSFQPVAVAYGLPKAYAGTTRKLFAWVGGVDTATEQVDEHQVRIRWRIQKGNVWLSSQSTAKTHYTNLSTAYDPSTDRFILAYLDNKNSNNAEDMHVYVQTINAWNGEKSCLTILDSLSGIHPYQIGDMSCDYYNNSNTTQCTIPISDLANEGPHLQFIQGQIGPLPIAGQQVDQMCFQLNSEEPVWDFPQFILGSGPEYVDSFGPIGSATRGYDSIGPIGPGFFSLLGYSDILVTHVNGQSADGTYQSFILSTDANGIIDVIDQEADLFTNYWPLRVGSMSWAAQASGRAKWRAITYE